MLGFDYTGQTYLAAYPLGKFVIDILETLEVDENIKIYAHHVLENLEEIEVEDDVNTIVGQLLRIVERMDISDNLKMNFMILILEGVILYERMIGPVVQFTLQEIAYLSDVLNYMGTIVIKEIVTIMDILKINGKQIFVFWEKCYSKTEAVVENMYKKFRSN